MNRVSRATLASVTVLGALVLAAQLSPVGASTGSPVRMHQDLPPEMQTLIAKTSSGRGSAAFMFHASYQFSGASTANGQFDDGNTGGDANSCTDVASNGDQLVGSNFPFFRVPTPQGPEFATTGPTFIVNTMQLVGAGTYKPDNGTIAVLTDEGLQAFAAGADTASPSLTINADGSGSFAWTNAQPDSQLPPLVVPPGTTLSGSIWWTCA